MLDENKLLSLANIFLTKKTIMWHKTRIFSSITDRTAIHAGQTMHDLLENSLEDFTAFDSSIDEDYVADFQAAIDAAARHTVDKAVRNGISDLHQTVEEQMVVCREKFKFSRVFIKKAFPENRAIHNRFGFGDYRAASYSPKKMLYFMDIFYDIAVENADELAAVGYDGVAIAGIATLRDSLLDAHRNKVKAIKNRPVQTEDRIEKLNTMWAIMQRIAKVSKRIYKNNRAKYRQFLLLKPAGKRKKQNNTIVSVKTQVNNSPLAGAMVHVENLNISVSTGATGKGGLVLPEGSHVLVITHPDHATVTKTITVLPGEIERVSIVMTPI